MAMINIALIPGDGIGPEVLEEGVKAVKAAEKAVGGFSLNFDTFEAGAECYRSRGDVLPESTYDGCSEADAIFVGSMGLPDVTYPDGTEVGVEATLQLRFRLNLFANIRPVKLYPNVPSKLQGFKAGQIDYVIFRENVEGLYASRGGGSVTQDRIAVDTMIISREGTERVSRAAFEYAQARNGAPRDGKSRVTCVDKANILRSYSFFRKVYTEVASEYPDVETDYAYIDAMACWMVLQPDCYDVIVTENMFGDIITDLGAATVGGMGMSPSGEIGENHGLFQGSHGSAPTIAGKNVANPVATVISGKMMLDWLAQRKKNDNLKRAADLIELAVIEVLKDGELTADLGGNTSTTGFGDAVERKIFDLAEERK